MRRDHAFKPWLLAVAASGLVLAGCAEEAPGPQFASDPLPSRSPIETPVPASPSPGVYVATPVAIATPASLGDLVVARGALKQVFVSSNGEIWSVTSSGESSRVFTTVPEERLLAFAPSPDSTSVAVLVESGEGASRERSLFVVDDRGEEELFISGFRGTSGTPVARGTPGADRVDWSPQGQKALVALSDGGLFTIDLTDGSEPSALKVATGGRTILAPTWSPTGASIAFVTEDAEGQARALSVLDVQSGTVTDAVRPPEGRFVIDYAWMPDGVSLLFTEGGGLGGAVTGIDLWRIDASGKNRTLVASAGTVAPVARISNPRPSPDGQRVAYSVLVPGDGAPLVDSVWVRDLASGVGFRVPMPVVESIDEIWWTDKGLVISTVTRGSAQSRSPVLALLIAKNDGATDILWAMPIVEATPMSGTPVATPVP